MSTRKATPTAPPPTLLYEFVPVTPLILPWPCLCADNHRLMWVYGQARLTADYRRAKSQVAERAALWWRGPLLSVDVALTAVFWFPDRRKRDAGNYRKLVTDALTGIVYADDSLIADERYIRAEIDRTNPRCELKVWPLLETKAAA